ncbi:cell division protein CrgA [Streptomyces sp. NPDC001774]
MRSRVSFRPEVPWAAWTAVVSGILGILWISIYYVTDGAFPVAAWDKWNIVTGISMIVMALIAAARQR